MLGLDKLGKSFGERTLFSGVSLQLDAGRRYGLVGANGSGKTTLMKVLCGDEPATEGAVTLAKNARMGVLRQDRFLDDEEIILQLAMMGDRPVWDALEEQRALTEESSPDPTRVAELEEMVRMNEGYTLEARASGILEGLGIPGASHRRPLRTLSGGFKLRVLLAQVLVGRPDVLMLDEPTNHLDILTIRWLEKFLGDYVGCAVVISHDHRFLENVATHILDIDYETVTLYPGGYAAFEEQKLATRQRKEAEIARAEQTVAEKKAFVERFRAKATKARQAQSRLKQIDKIEIEKLPETSRRAPKFRFEQERNSGRDVLEASDVCKAYGDNEVLTDLSITVRRGERVAVIGANGLGKSTLLKILVDQLAADKGALRWGYETRVGYFPQDHRELLGDAAQSALDALWDTCPAEPVARVRGQLGMVLLTGDDVHKPVGALSGGEVARLIMARLMMQRPNVLVLDEPTNHLDLESISALLDALEAYEGTLLFVSHDRWFVSRLATRIVELTPSGPRDFPGGYDDYIHKCGDDHLDADQVVQRAKRATTEAKRDGADGGASWQAQKRRRNRIKELESRRDRLTTEIDCGERRQSEIQALYCRPGFFEETSEAEVEALEQEDALLGPRVEALLDEWEQVETELTTLVNE